MAEYTHAGGIVVRMEQGAPQYLVVTARRNPDHWLFPKGHIDPGETVETAAIREVLEEAGVVAGILSPVGSAEYETSDGQRVHARFFLMRYVGDSVAAETRHRRWCSYEEALSQLSWDVSRDLLRRAHTVAESTMPL
jgi:8-oxo-dGTP pyrophosphatase MutT (NUDIX family)